MLVRRVCVIAWLCVVGCGDGYQNNGGVMIDVGEDAGVHAGSAGVEVGYPSGPLVEGGQAVTVTVTLKRAPSAPVTIHLASSDEAAGTVSPASLSFDGASWGAAQVVTLTPVDDALATGDKRWQLNFAVSSDDATFADEALKPLKLKTIDDDGPPVIVAAAVSAPQTTEAGGAVTLVAQLSKQPAGDVLVPVQLSAPAEAEVNIPMLTFTTLNWNVPQQLVVTGKDDQQRDGDRRYEVEFGPANSADEEFNGIGPAEVALTNLDGVCGNGVVDGAEPCEPSGVNECEFGQMDCMVCNNACELVPGDVTGFCGDGVVQADKGEACDEPVVMCAYGQMSCTVCGPQCQPVAGQPSGFCGDGVVQGQEQCDGPTEPCAYGQMSCMACRDCQHIPGQVTGFCGDGVLQADKGEECDGAPTQTCMGNGAITCNAQCKNDGSRCFSVAQIASGEEHSCAVMQGGAVRCWGANESGQLGDPSYRQQASAQPRLVAGLTGVVAVSAGTSHTCALVTGGTVKCWGQNVAGQLGDGTTIDRRSPVAVTGLTDVVQISSGEYHTCAVLANGQARCWGYNDDGRLGIGMTGGSKYTPQVVVGQNGSGQLTGVAQISAGETLTCAVLTSGQVKCWGVNSAGSLGTGAYDDSDSPAAVAGITNARQVSARRQHACAVLTSGQIKCWGSNLFGELGAPSAGNLSATPVLVSGINNAVDVGVGGGFSCAALANGQAKCWGGSSEGQAGDGTSVRSHDTPVNVSGIQSAKAVAVGAWHACALLQGGEGRCWGLNASNQLSQSDAVDSASTPAPINF